MKKPLTYLLFLIFCYQIGGYIVSFNILKHDLESDYKNKLAQDFPNKSFSYFKFNVISQQSSFKWEESGKEFWLDGKLYDIVSNDCKGTMKCLNDDQEKALFQKLDQQINGFFANTSIGKKALQNINSVFFTIYLSVKAISIPYCFDFIIDNNFKRLHSRKVFIALAIDSPPPRFI